MGNSEQKQINEAMHKLLEANGKQIDELTLERDTLQTIILEEMQNPQNFTNIHNTFQEKYSTLKNSLKDNLNKSVYNSNYFEKYQVIIINILFIFDSERINVVTPTDFNLKNVYSIALEKLSNKENYVDINSLSFEYNSNNISKFFINNNEVRDLKIADKGAITILKKTNLTGM